MRGTHVRLCRGLMRPILFCGVNKNALFLYGTFSLLIIYVTRFNFPYALIGVLVFYCFHAITVWGHKKDPQILSVLLKHIQYKGFYPPVSFARAKPFAANNESKSKKTSIPKF